MQNTKKICLINWIMGFIYAMSIVFGYSAECFSEVRLNNWKTYFFIILITIVASLWFKLAWDYIATLKSKKTAKPVLKDDDLVKSKANNIKAWFLWSSIIWVLYFTVFLGVYPGFFCYDAQDELIQTITRTFTTQHPLLHVLGMGAIVQGIHKVTNNYNLGIAGFILFQMSVISAGLGYIVCSLKRKGLSKLGQVCLTLYFGLFPVCVMYALCSSKDGLFGIFLTFSVLLFLRFIDTKDDFTRIDFVLVLLSLILMMLLRNNGIYAFFVFAVISVGSLLLDKDIKSSYLKCIKSIVVLFLISIMVFFISDKALKLSTNASDVGHREILTVPIQQLARIYSYDNVSLTEEEKQSIERFIPKESLIRYTPKCSDMVKIGFNEEAFTGSRLEFFKTWLSIGIKHPQAYVNAWVMTSYGMYYPLALIDGYKGNEMFTFTYGDSSYFGYEVEQPGRRESLIPVIDRIYKWFSLDKTIQRVPVIGLMFSPGFMLWALLFGIGFLIYSGNKESAIVYLLPLLVVMTCLLGPMSLVRYAYYLWIIVPILYIHIFID